MHLNKKVAVLAAAAFATLLGSSAVAKSQWQIIELDYGYPPEYVSCLGEHVSSYYWVTLRYREFETPSGNSHYIEYWTWESEYVGQVTGRVWLGKGQSPGTSHVAKGEVSQWTSRELARPVVGDGPKFRYNLRFKVTVNANGELKVFYEEPSFALDDTVRCLGSND